MTSRARPVRDWLLDFPLVRVLSTLLGLCRVFPRILWFLVPAFFGLIVSLVLLVVWASYGYIHGEEICPHTFQRRHFSYWQPSFVSKGLGKTETSHDEFSVALALTGTMPKQVHQRWDLVSDNYTSPWSRDLEANFLAEVLDRRAESGEYFWVEWSAANVELAKRLWPLVSQLAAERLYVIVPELFMLTSVMPPDLPPAEFELRLREVVLRHLTALREEAVAADWSDEIQRLDQALLNFKTPSAE